MSTRTATALATLERGGIDVRVTAGGYARYRFHHAKYAVVDERALVTSENWKPSGIGGRSSRGWGVITQQRAIVGGLVETFRADTGWLGAVPWSEHDVSTVEGERANKSYPANFETESFNVSRTALLVAPDNAESRIRTAIQNAEHSLEIKQVQIGGPQFPFLQDVLAAAERGVEVRILLSGTWYAQEENEQLKTWLDEQASAGDLPLEVRIADPTNAFEKIHAKGLIVDDRQTLVGSINWNNNSIRRNREIALLIESEEVAAYFGAVFEADWNGDDRRNLPLGLALAALFVAGLAVLGASQLQFDE
jgi:phosphatidylserine/phosphatidylglycerophosphate/cardiolipin synthase-like enzyme